MFVNRFLDVKSPSYRVCTLVTLDMVKLLPNGVAPTYASNTCFTIILATWSFSNIFCLVSLAENVTVALTVVFLTEV